jgi:hypothetical protein
LKRSFKVDSAHSNSCVAGRKCRSPHHIPGENRRGTGQCRRRLPGHGKGKFRRGLTGPRAGNRQQDVGVHDSLPFPVGDGLIGKAPGPRPGFRPFRRTWRHTSALGHRMIRFRSFHRVPLVRSTKQPFSA